MEIQGPVVRDEVVEGGRRERKEGMDSESWRAERLPS